MTYEEATAKVGELKARFDRPFDASDKAVIESLYFEVTRKRFVPTTFQQCYHDALIEIYLKLKKEKAMPKQCNYVMKAGFIISCPRISDEVPTDGEILPEDTKRGTHREQGAARRQRQEGRHRPSRKSRQGRVTKQQVKRHKHER